MSDETRWFGIKLGETSEIILFYIALIGVIETTTLLLSIISIIEFIQYGMPIESILREVIMIVPKIILLPIFCYTLSMCAKFKKEERKIQHSNDTSFNTTKMFGFLLTQKTGIIIFFFALIGVLSVIPSFYFYTYILREYIRSSLSFGVIWIRMLGILALSHYLTTLITELVIFSYSIVKFTQVRKNVDR